MPQRRERKMSCPPLGRTSGRKEEGGRRGGGGDPSLLIKRGEGVSLNEKACRRGGKKTLKLRRSEGEEKLQASHRQEGVSARRKNIQSNRKSNF